MSGPDFTKADRSWIQTRTGRKFRPLAPRVEDFALEDLAHALAIVNRFTGHTERPYSVAEHSVRVSIRAEYLARAHGRPEAVVKTVAKWGLVHDGSEAYLADIASPVKHQPELSLYRAAEKKLMNTLCDWLGLDHKQPDDVSQADLDLLFTEAEQLMTPLHPEFKAAWGDKWKPLPEPHGTLGWGWLQSKAAFIQRFEYLFGVFK